MDQNVPMDIVRVVMILANIVVLLGGCAVIVIGVMFISGIQSFLKIFSDQFIFSNAVYLIFTVGILLFVIGIFGFCGTFYMNKWMLLIFFVLMTVIFVLNLAACILSFVFYNSLKTIAIDSLSYYDDNDSDKSQNIKTAWDAIQSSFECCGITGINDWYTASVLNPPPPCSSTLFVKGCEEYFSSQYLVLGIVVAVILLSQLVTMAFSAILYFRQLDLDKQLKFKTEIYELPPAAVEDVKPPNLEAVIEVFENQPAFHEQVFEGKNTFNEVK